jgi:uncharacterized membrane protein
MQLPDSNHATRLDSVRAFVNPESPFSTSLAEKFKVRQFKFSNAIERIGDLGQLGGQGQQTNLPLALEQTVRETAGLPLSAVIVISDGASNSEENTSANFASTLSSLRARGVPVFTVGVGEMKLDGDIELARATAPARVIAGSTVTAELLVRANGQAQKTVKIDVTEDNHLLRSQHVPVQTDSTTVAKITFTPSSPGLHRYRFVAEPDPGEPIGDNNTQEILIEVADSRPKILYVEGEPRWEYGKLRRVLEDEKNLILVSVLRSADGKFYRQGIEKSEELSGGFPKSEEELFAYDAIIIGSLEATFFSFDQLRVLEQFVARRGGTFMAIGGPKAFNAGGYTETPVADLLPVVLNREPASGGESQTFFAQPSSRGRDHPAARLEDDPDANSKAWEKMPAISIPEVVTETKPGATVILEGRSATEKDRSVPLLVEQRYGRGRTLALLGADTWRWRMMLEFKNKSYETFWRNLLRHLVGSVRRRVEATTQRNFYGQGEQVQMRVEVADEKYNSVRDAQVSARISTPTGQVSDIPFKPVTDGGFEGYSGLFPAAENGIHNVEVTVRAAGDKAGSIGTVLSSFLVGDLNLESRNADQNRELLRRISADTGGTYYPLDQTHNIAEDIAQVEGGNSVRETRDLWDMPINFLLAIGLAAAEWFIRKRKGLA